MKDIKNEGQIIYRKAIPSDSLRLSVLCSHVFIDAYCPDGVNTESAIFISKEFSLENTEKKLNNNTGRIVLATFKDNLVGVAELEFNKVCPVKNIIAPELNKLYVLESFIGKGIGFNLLKEVENIILSEGNKDIWLSVLATNQRAVSFYYRQGFEWIGNFDFQMEFNSYDNKVMYKKL